MKRVVAWLAPLFALMLGPADCRAQADNADQLKKFVASDFHKGLIDGALASIPPAMFQRCPALKSDGMDVSVLEPISYGGNGRPNAGAWKEAIPVTGCGADAVLNIYFQAGKGGKVKTIVGFPGSTHADLVLQGDAQTYAIVGAGIVDKDCKSFIVKDTRFEAFGLADPPKPDPGPDDSMRPWWETWTVEGCNRTFEIQIDFAPDATGTQIIQPDGGRKERK